MDTDRHGWGEFIEFAEFVGFVGLKNGDE